ncbi:beta-galactosidase BglB [Konateibacter massiliensis]|uniref:beta-galactosidase BglB n=1 Tax=Konateibacter massiliensis TaxID=2002841 RepID=UPI000C150E8D|nr:glycoside hydrolase family 88 protein [Konateibacter massiliensis]
MNQNTDKQVTDKLVKLIDSFTEVLYEEDETFLENMKTKNLAGDDIRKYQFWEWTQGVGLFGFWRYFEYTKDEKYLDILIRYYDRQMEIGFPAKNVNTTAPMLAMSYLVEYTKNEAYKKICDDWAEWIYTEMPRTEEGGLQHTTSDTLNDQELWDDTLFMTVLFLANMGRMNERKDYVEEAKYQFLLHTKYLADKKTGLWFHGYTFHGNHNFAEALWGRGNCWITAAIPEFLDMVECDAASKRFLEEALRAQVEGLVKYQDETGMWHTLVDDKTSYVEASATCGFAYGILRAAQMGIIDKSLTECAQKALEPILSCITEEGKVNQVSYGTAMGRESKDFYKSIEIKSMPYGQALAILFLIEAKKTL